jgi:hypothetical protein
MLKISPRAAIILVMLSFVVTSAACSSAATASPTPIPPTATSLPPTATENPPTATQTPLPPTATPTLTSTPTFTDTPTVPPTDTPTATPSPTATRLPGAALPMRSGSGKDVLIYLISLNTGGGVGCGDSAIGVAAGVPETGKVQTDIRSALTVLFNLNSKYVGGYYNPVSYSILRVQDVKFDGKKDHVTVWLSGKYKPTGDDCDNTRVKAQIWSTIKQFQVVHSTDIYINGPHPFGDFVSNDK